MPALVSKASTLARAATRTQLPAVRAAAAAPVTAVQQRNAGTTSNFDSPFKTTKIPDFSHYKGGSEAGNKVFGYFMVGALGGLSALGAKNTVSGG